MARAQRPTRVHTTNPYTIGGGLEWKDLFPLPVWVWVIVLTVKTAFKNFVPLTVGIILFVWFVMDWATYGFLGALIRAGIYLLCFLVLFSLFLYGQVYARYTYAPTFKRLSWAIYRWWVVRNRWKSACHNAGFRRLPKLKKIRFSPNGVIAKTNCGKKGITPNDFKAGADEIVGTLGGHELKVESDSPARATLHMIWGDPTSRILLPGDLEGMQPFDQNSVVFALDPDHMGVEISYTTSILICGLSESGKSNALWSILNGMNNAGLRITLRVIDPAGGVELQELEDSPMTVEYVDTVPGADNLIARANTAMDERLAEMKRRSISVWDEDDVDVLVVDELLLLNRYDEHSLFGKRLSSGRKAKHIVIALSQLSQKDALGVVRDLFPQRMCHATKSEQMTNTALGEGAHKDGAKCTEINQATPGVGYIWDRQTRSYTRFRTPLIDKADRRAIANGEVIRSKSGAVYEKARRMSPLQLRRTARYKLFTWEGRLGYTGIGWAPDRRINQHREKWWFDQIDENLTEIEWYDNRKQAKEAETWSIVNEDPLFNKAEKVDDRQTAAL